MIITFSDFECICWRNYCSRNLSTKLHNKNRKWLPRPNSYSHANWHILHPRHDSFMLTREMTHIHTGHDSIIHIHTRHDSFFTPGVTHSYSHETWLIHVHTRHDSYLKATWLIHIHVRHDSYSHGTWLNHSYPHETWHILHTRHGSFIFAHDMTPSCSHETWLIYVYTRNDSYSHGTWLNHSYPHQTWLILHTRHDSFIFTRDMTHIHTRHDSTIQYAHETWLNHQQQQAHGIIVPLSDFEISLHTIKEEGYTLGDTAPFFHGCQKNKPQSIEWSLFCCLFLTPPFPPSCPTPLSPSPHPSSFRCTFFFLCPLVRWLGSWDWGCDLWMSRVTHEGVMRLRLWLMNESCDGASNIDGDRHQTNTAMKVAARHRHTMTICVRSHGSRICLSIYTYIYIYIPIYIPHSCFVLCFVV